MPERKFKGFVQGKKAEKTPIPRNVLLLGLVSFFTDMHSEIILPLLPIFLTDLLGASTVFLGLIEGVADATSNIVKGFSGWLSDIVRSRKSLIVMGYYVSFFSKIIMAIANTGSHVLGLRFLDRIGKGIRTSPRDALIADSTPGKNYGRSFGIHRAMDTLGAVVGAALASILMIVLSGNIRLAFAIAAIPGIAAVVSVLFVREKAPRPEQGIRKEMEISSDASDRRKRLVFAGFGLFYLSNISYAFYILKLNELKFSQAAIPVAYLVYNIVYTLLSVPAGRLSDRIGRRRVIIIGIISHVLLCLGFATANAAIYGWLLFVLYGVVSSVAETVPKAFISDITRYGMRGSSFGVYNMTIGISSLIANTAAGLLWDKFGSTAAFSAAAIIASLSIPFFLRDTDEND